jgi:hypothetical protein
LTSKGTHAVVARLLRAEPQCRVGLHQMLAPAVACGETLIVKAVRA